MLKWDRKGKRKKVQFMRPVSMMRLIMFQMTAILVGVIANLAFNIWHHEMTMMELQSKYKDTTRLVRTCNDVGWKQCNEFRVAWKENRR